MAKYIDEEVMTLDEAIKHAKKVALDNKRQATYNFQVLEPYYTKCEQCAEEHEQLARWLEELKRYRTADVVEVVRCKDCIYYKEGELLAPNKFCYRLMHPTEDRHIGYNFADDDFCSYGKKVE